MIEILFLIVILEILQYFIQRRLIKEIEMEIRNANIESIVQKKRIEQLSKQITELQTRAVYSEEQIGEFWLQFEKLNRAKIPRKQKGRR